MKILFHTSHRSGPSTQLNLQALTALEQQYPAISLRPFAEHAGDEDVVLLMGYDHDIETARKRSPRAIIGIIDIRPQQKQPIGADFIVVNGYEMADWCSRFRLPLIQYPIFPELPLRSPSRREDSSSLILGYHGNSKHLRNWGVMMATALPALAHHFQIEIHAVYDRRTYGTWHPPFATAQGITIKHLQWEAESYSAHLAKCHVGITPGLVPVFPERAAKLRQFLHRHGSAAASSDFRMRFKASSNPGRAMVFAQLGVPVVSDAIPSMIELISDGEDGFTCLSTEKWVYALERLQNDEHLRLSLAQRFQENFLENWSRQVINARFKSHLDRLIEILGRVEK